jgi:hypothetical protein
MLTAKRLQHLLCRLYVLCMDHMRLLYGSAPRTSRRSAQRRGRPTRTRPTDAEPLGFGGELQVIYTRTFVTGRRRSAALSASRRVDRR